MKKVIILLIVAVAVAGGVFLASRNKQPAAPSAGEQKQVGQKQEEAVITYTDSGYLPSSIEIKAGTRVIFKNQSRGPMWPASAMHPTHAVYPTTGGCIGSTFDACHDIEPGASWPFVFDIAGSWKYHDHLNPGRFGAINVK